MAEFSPAEIAAAEEVARAAAGELVGTLLPELAGAMERGGAVEAIGVCADRAQELTAGVEAEYSGVRLRRTSLRVRNPVNRPDAYERAWMESLETPAAEARVVGDELRYLQPLVMGELCLRCHGPAEGINPGVRAVLAERYPEDEAVGFGVGELRGVVSVRVGLE
ncbi:MAG: DUF3365 domain-containing protein [Phycisphaerales bacterium JB054]